MTSEKRVRYGVVGTGIMGTSHVRDVVSLDNSELVAVCDADKARTDAMAEQYNIAVYNDYDEFLSSPEIDAVIVATPHYSHTPLTIAALEAGKHVLTEKPIAVTINDAQKMIDTYHEQLKSNPDLKFGAVFMQRTYGFWKKIKDLIDTGELGKLLRTTWLITDWFRTDFYYAMGSWRATWESDGGGVLMNQAPHNLDMYQWLVGMPSRVMGFASFGKYHDIQVEDEVTAYFEHDNGMIGHFISSTAEMPGTNRLEIMGENGKLIYENGEIEFYRNRVSSIKLLRESQRGFEKGEVWKVKVPFQHHGQGGHRFIIENFADSILNGTPLIAPGVDGMHSIMLANAVVYSSVERRFIDLPLDGDAYDTLLEQLIAKYA